MIFVTVGSQKFQFDRLVKAVDLLVADGTITEPVFGQIGECTYVPQHFAYQRFMDQEEFREKMSDCDIVLTHGGTGVITGAIKSGKGVVAMPRLAKYGEHVDDHQIELLQRYADLICVCMDADRLAESLEQCRNGERKPFVSNTAAYIEELGGILDALEQKCYGRRK